MNSLWENLFRRQGEEGRVFGILKDNILFRDLASHDIEMIQNIMNERSFRAGEEVFRQGDSGIGMYLIVSGTVSIFLEQIMEHSTIRRTLITELHSGDFFGEAALVIEGGRRSATATAKEDCRVLSFANPDLLEIITKYPLIGNRILFRLGEVLGTRLRETNKKVMSLIMENESLKKKIQDKDQDEPRNPKTHTA